MSDDPFQQSQFIAGIHNIPRFGHSNSISKLASFQRSEQEDYVRGILAFVVFASIALYAWTVVVTAFKLLLEPTNCASGGALMDVARLRKQKIPRDQRRRRILRSWRIQNVFMAASILIPIITLLMTRNGLKPLINSLDEVESISDEVEAVAFRGIAIAESLQQARHSIQRNLTHINLEELCTTSPAQSASNSSILVLPMDILTKYIAAGWGEVKGFIDEYANEATTGLQRVVGVTSSLDTTIEWIFRNDWIFKFFLLTINVVNLFFLVGVFFSKQDLVFPSYQRFLSYSLIPTFALLLVASLVVSCVFGMSAMVNADFCYRSNRMDGTMHDIIVKSGIEKSDLTYQAFMHYMEGCFGDHPLDFVHSLDSVIKHTKDAVALLESSLDATTPTELRQHCTDDVFILSSATSHLHSMLDEVQRQVRAVIELTGCHQINPVLRRILYGVTCSATVDSLTWLFGGMWCITLLGFTMITIRAALHNSVVRAPRRRRKRETEKEFEEYKQYMAEFYEDADRWQLDAPRKDKGGLQPDTIPQIPTFDTEDMSVSPRHDEADGSDAACFASPQKRSDDPSSCSSSSYESDYSSDSDDLRSNMSFSMLVGRVFHTRQNNSILDESQSQLPGVSVLSHDEDHHQKTPSRPVGILKLQTPRRRVRRQMPSPILPLPSSPTSPQLLPPPQGAQPYVRGSLLANDSSSSDGSIPVRVAAPRWNVSTPMAPSKPRRKVYRTNGAKKES